MYVLRFFFDYGGTCLWAANDAARDRFGYPIELSALPIPDDVRSDLIRVGKRYDTSLDLNDPAGPSLWSDEQFRQFDELADGVLSRLRTTLGSEFQIRDERAKLGNARRYSAPNPRV